MDWVDGTDLARVLAERGAPGLAPSGVLAHLAEAAEDAQGGAEETPTQVATEPEPEPEKAPEPEKGPAPEQPGERPAAAESGDAAGYVTPLVRKLAADHGIDLASLKDTGIGGRILKQDVLAAAEAAKQAATAAAAPAAEQSASTSTAPASVAAPAPAVSGKRGTTEKMTRLRQTIAKRMVESLQVSAQLTTVVEVDVTAVARLRESVKADFAAREGVKLTFMPFFAKAAIDSLKTHPALNAAIDPEKGEVTYFDHENLAVAVDTEKGLILLKGAVPGPKGGLVVLRSAAKNPQEA